MTATLLPTSQVFTVVSDLAACLCAEIETTPDLPALCFCGVVPGEVAAQDYSGDGSGGKCGMAWVRLASLYPASGVGEPNTNAGNCDAGLGADIEMGVMRCITVGDAMGNPPTPTQLLDAA